MPSASSDRDTPHLLDMLRAIDRIREVTVGLDLAAFEADWQRQWLVERGLEIVSEASRRLSPALQARHGAIPWRKVAGIGNVLRHEYQRVAPAILWAVSRHELDDLAAACAAELAARA